MPHSAKLPYLIGSFGLVLALTDVALAADNKSQSAQPRVNIEPRTRTSPDREQPSGARQGNLRVDSTLVLIPVTVTDPLNRVVTGLEKEHFKLKEDKADQELTHFAMEDAPLSIGLVFDMSGSMGAKLTKSRQAAAHFFWLRIRRMSSFLSSLTIVRS
jgi:hypothetical protein